VSVRLPNFFVAGFQKCATTWLHHCLLEHPQIFVPELHMLHFFDIHYERGFEWYRSFFKDANHAVRIGDTTVSYARDPNAAKRISEFDPNVLIIFCLRHPIERAFSHYWHEKKKGKIAFRFEELFENYDLFNDWVRPGFYAEHINRFYEYFPKNQMLILLVDDIESNPLDVIRQMYIFLEVDAEFQPPSLKKRVNKAWFKPSSAQKIVTSIGNKVHHTGRFIPKTIKEMIKRTGLKPSWLINPRSEYDLGMPAHIREQLLNIFRPEVKNLSNILQRDLNRWLY
jgi:hypothetical protein